MKWNFERVMAVAMLLLSGLSLATGFGNNENGLIVVGVILLFLAVGLAFEGDV